MPRKLILIPRSRLRVTGATTIEPGYPKQYTPDDMRGWADDLDRLNRTPPDEVERWRTLPPESLSAEQSRVLEVRHKLFDEHRTGIKGSLLPDRTVELDGGRHRAGYMIERGVDPMPVWVSAPEQRELDAFHDQCRSERLGRADRDTRPESRERV